MGFGFLLYGFMMILEVGLVVNSEYGIGLDIFPDLAGYLFMIGAAKLLKDYSNKFSRMLIPIAPLTVVGAVNLAAQLMAAFGLRADLANTLIITVKYAEYPLAMLTFFFMFMGIREISRDCGNYKIERRVGTALTLNFTYYLLRIFLLFEKENTMLGIGASLLYTVSMLTDLIFYVFLLYSMFEIFSCYMYICAEGDENMDKPKVFNPLMALLNYIRKKKNGQG